MALTLASGSQTAYRIVLSSECSPSERHAATELAFFLEKVTGASFPVCQSRELFDSPRIVVGLDSSCDASGLGRELEALGSDGFIIRTVGRDLVIAGGRLRGTMYGVYAFLEDHVGCRWYSSTVAAIPRKLKLSVPAIDRKAVPAFAIRDPYYYDAFDADWSARNKCNGLKTPSWSQGCRADEQRGGPTRLATFYESFKRMVPPSTYFADHPEYFSLINGKRVAGLRDAQLCLTHPDVVRIVAEAAEALAARYPGAIVPVSQNDGFGNCECPNCRALDEKEGSPSGTLIHFVNQVAERVCVKHPDVTIATEAYIYTRKPPLHAKPHPNVMVTFAPYGLCYAHDVTCPLNDAAFDDLRGWVAQCKNVHIWDYCTNFSRYLQPHPNLYQLPEVIRTYRDLGVTGVTQQGNYDSPGGEFAELRAWLIGKLLWDPSVDFEAALTDFLSGFYGQAAEPIRQYIDLMHRPYVDNENLHLRLNSQSVPFDRGFYESAHQLFDQAEEAVAGDPEVSHRVRVARLPLEYITLLTLPEDRAKRENRVRKFFEVTGAASITHCREGSQMPELRSAFESVRACENVIEDFYLLGPFDNTQDGKSAGLTRAFPPEERVDLSAAYPGKDDRTVRWKRVFGNLGLVNLIARLGTVENAVAYAWTAFDVKEEKAAKLLVGSDDGVAVWHNGQKVLCVETTRSFEADSDSAELLLSKGRNELLFKVDQKEGEWGFMARFAGKVAGMTPLSRLDAFADNDVPFSRKEA